MVLNAETGPNLPDGIPWVRLWDSNAPDQVIHTPRTAFTRFVDRLLEHQLDHLEATDDEMCAAAAEARHAVGGQHGIRPDPHHEPPYGSARDRQPDGSAHPTEKRSEVVTHSLALPPPGQVAQRARIIMTDLQGDAEYAAFERATLEYSEDWQCFSGFPVISEWHLENDAPALLTEGLRALSLKAAVFELTGDERAAEIAIAVPVDEMTHAMIAQPQLFSRITARVGMSIIHQTDQEHTDYRRGGFTHSAYEAAWGEPPARYWIDHPEVLRRQRILADRYERIGLGRSGREHRISFAV